MHTRARTTQNGVSL